MSHENNAHGFWHSWVGKFLVSFGSGIVRFCQWVVSWFSSAAPQDPNVLPQMVSYDIPRTAEEDEALHREALKRYEEKHARIAEAWKKNPPKTQKDLPFCSPS